ncbi:MAG: hypothetical protein KAH30_03330, partial [Caldisericia bacterium]|nr:hypothetical protein [Caldisericia bacterium]
MYRITKVTDALGNEKEYFYDNSSNLTKVEAPPQANPPTTEFDYDDVGRMTQFTDPLDESGTFTFNNNGLMTSKT